METNMEQEEHAADLEYRRKVTEARNDLRDQFLTQVIAGMNEDLQSDHVKAQGRIAASQMAANALSEVVGMPIAPRLVKAPDPMPEHLIAAPAVGTASNKNRTAPEVAADPVYTPYNSKTASQRLDAAYTDMRNKTKSYKPLDLILLLGDFGLEEEQIIGVPAAKLLATAKRYKLVPADATLLAAAPAAPRFFDEEEDEEDLYRVDEMEEPTPEEEEAAAPGDLPAEPEEEPAQPEPAAPEKKKRGRPRKSVAPEGQAENTATV